MRSRGFYNRSNHGTERRGVFPVRKFPSFEETQKQSKRDKEAILRRTREIYEGSLSPENIDFGNKELPAYKHKSEILANIEANKAVILGGPTGSGKSTQVPQYLYEAGYDKVYILAPRRVISDGLGDRIREEMSEHLSVDVAEGAVGIVHGERSEWNDDTNGIVVMTPNTFIKMQAEIAAKHGGKKVAIISDEIHEANLFTEIATGVAAMSVKEHENWRLIAASATHNTSELTNALSKVNDGYVPSIEIEGRPFNVEMNEEPELSSIDTYMSHGDDHEKSMIFTSGKEEIDHIIDELIAKIEVQEKGSSNNVIFRKLHAELTRKELSQVNDPVPEGKRLVVVSSPAGMSGITIPGVTLVISDGTINRSELDDNAVLGLRRHYLSRAEVIQQAGRAGRDVPGGVFFLSKPTAVREDGMIKKGIDLGFVDMPFVPFSERKEHAPPEIYSSILSGLVLEIAAGGRNFSDINEYLVHPVEPSVIIAAEKALIRLGAFDHYRNITKIGKRMSKFPLPPELSRGLVEVERRKLAGQQMFRAAIMAAAIDAGGLQDYTNIKDKRWTKIIRHSTDDDFMAQLDLMIDVLSVSRKSSEDALVAYARENDLHPVRIDRAKKVAGKILKIMGMNISNTVPEAPLVEHDNELRESMAAGMIDLVYRHERKQQRRNFYKNIHSEGNYTERYISSRSILRPVPGQFIAAIPRWYTKKDKEGEEVLHNIIEMTLKVDPRVIGEYAIRHDALDVEHVGSRLEGGRVVERVQNTFGTIKVGQERSITYVDYISDSSRKMIVNASLEKPLRHQKELRETVRILNTLKNIIPEKELEEYRLSNDYAEIDSKYINDLLYELSSKTRNIVELDEMVGDHIFKKNITIGRYYDRAAIDEILARSPVNYCLSDGVEVPVRYENGSPYLTGLTLAQKRLIKGPLYLRDGREILIQVNKSGSGTERISGAEVLKRIQSR